MMVGMVAFTGQWLAGRAKPKLEQVACEHDRPGLGRPGRLGRQHQGLKPEESEVRQSQG